MLLQCVLQRAEDKVCKGRSWIRYVTKTKHAKSYGMQQKAVLRGKFIDENAHIGEEISEINNHAFYLKKLEREKQTKPKANRKKI